MCMFKKNGTESQTDLFDSVELAKEKARLEVENETLKWKLQDSDEKIKALRGKIVDLAGADAVKISEENKKLARRVEELEFAIANNTEQIEMETENATLKSEQRVLLAENEHLKKLLDTYRAMPDVENMIKHLSQLAVPSINQLSEFASALESTDISKLLEKMDRLSTIMTNVGDEFHYGVWAPPRRR